jgi:D-3-phosphoglycerate dehydrogenase
MSIKILITDPLSDKGIECLKKSGLEVIYLPNSSIDEIQIYLADISGWIIRSGTKISNQNICDAKKLQIIGRAGVGTDNIDINSATKNGIIVMNVPDGNTISAAEHTIAMMMSLSRNIHLGHMSLISGKWDRNKLVGNELRGKNLGVVGLGKIGREVIKRALSYDMKILGYDPFVSQDSFDKNEVKIVSIDKLTKISDYITLHVPMITSTKDLFDLNRLKMMKPSAKIINVARGGILNEEDLAYALKNDIISGAALDVFVNEPLDSKSSLLNAKNILLTPHLGASTYEAKEGVSLGICNQVIEYFSHKKLINALNIPVSDSIILKKMAPYYELTEKMGNILSQLSEGPIKEMKIICYGKALDSKSISLVLIKSVLSNIIDQRVNMVNADIIAKERNINFSHTYKNDEIPFSSLIKCIIKTEIGKFEISGSVFDKNHLRVVNIMGFDIDLNPMGKMLFIMNKDIPGVIGNIGTLLGKHNINIAEYLLGQINNSDNAYGIVKLNSKVSEDILSSLRSLTEILDVKQIIIEEN